MKIFVAGATGALARRLAPLRILPLRFVIALTRQRPVNVTIGANR